MGIDLFMEPRMKDALHFLPEKALFMAPMVDLSHEAFRDLVRGLSGCDLFYSEMLNARIVPDENPDKSLYLRFTRKEDLILQIVGNDPDKMRASARKLDAFAPWGIDINMGCSLKKVTCHGWGVALMQDLSHAQSVIAAVRSTTDRPLSAKLRIGYTLDKAYLLDFVSMLADAGVDFVVLHARLAQDGMRRKARWEYIAVLKERARIPVVGNGDIRTPQDAIAMLHQTACDGVMIGREAVTQPWIFRDIKAALRGEEIPPRPDIKAIMLDFSHLVEKHFPPDVALKRFKTAAHWLALNLAFGHHLMKLLNGATSLPEARARILAAFDAGMC
jgi:nifR3 family TIM-barrel protein